MAKFQKKIYLAKVKILQKVLGRGCFFDSHYRWYDYWLPAAAAAVINSISS